MGFPLHQSYCSGYVSTSAVAVSALLRIICRPKTKGTESFVSVSEKDIQRWRICGVQISGLPT